MSTETPGDFRQHRRRFLQGAGLLGMAAMLPALASCGRSHPLRIMLHDWPGYAFMHLAAQQGLVSPSQVQILRETSLGDSVTALANGDVDGAGLTLDTVLSLQTQGVDLVVVLVFNVSVGADALLARPERAALAALAGARVGAEDTALSMVMLNRALFAAGLARDDIEVVHFSGDAVATWNAGGLDAILAYQPAVQQLHSQGLVTVFDSRELPFLITDVLAVRREALHRSASALRRLVDGHFAVQQQWRADPLNSNYQLASLLGVDVQIAREVFRGINVPNAQFNRQYLTAPATELTAAAETLCAILNEEGACSPLPDFGRLFSAAYLPETR
ncbi:MAG: ABC transporter substrate-binding protein [Haliea sp.]|jgi:NitT/TauT family transport system substrate-binding protein